MKHRSFFIASSWWGNNDSVSLQYEALAQTLIQRGHQVVMLVDRQVNGVEDQGNLLLYNWPSRRPTKLADAYFLARLIHEHRPDCLIANFGSVNMMLVVGALMQVPVRIAWYHTLSTQIDIDSEEPLWQNKLLRTRKSLVYKLATHLIPVSKAASEDAQSVFGIPPHKCTVFYNTLADPLEKADQRPRLDRKEHVVCIGRLHFSKGQDVLLRATALLKDVFPELTVEFVGTGPARDAYEQLARSLEIEHQCFFTGRVHPDEVLKKMTSAAVVIVPSRSDNCPLVVIEALACGAPVVASATGGIVELLRDEVDGLLAPPDNPDALAEKLHKMIADKSLATRMGVNARRRFLEQFERSRVIGAQADWLESIVESCTVSGRA